MKADSRLPLRKELEALSESGFALAIQLLGRHEDSADVVQDALHKLVHSGGHYNSQKGSPLAWFLKVVRNPSQHSFEMSQFYLVGIKPKSARNHI